jgi:hypothetical protein
MNKILLFFFFLYENYEIIEKKNLLSKKYDKDRFLVLTVLSCKDKRMRNVLFLACKRLIFNQF